MSGMCAEVVVSEGIYNDCHGLYNISSDVTISNRPVYVNDVKDMILMFDAKSNHWVSLQRKFDSNVLHSWEKKSTKHDMQQDHFH